ncbi:hypothetical protein HNY73_012825 [Argiope bruennichi]|uniref:Uncharacterized protein n=1 Tax=Argiope bruennichi TaxID=94029 RepID=A0A8T0F0X7_ARGBR|nr:hypothetical protein HNY73_012825 [Argiope bruennichi]
MAICACASSNYVRTCAFYNGFSNGMQGRVVLVSFSSHSSPAMEGDGRSDDSSSCKSSWSSRSKYPGSFIPTDFILKINKHCSDLRNAHRDLNEAKTKAHKKKARLRDDISPSEKAAHLKYLDDYNRRIQTNEEKLRNEKPCIRRDCRPHDGNKNLCVHIKNHQTRIQQLNSIALTFIDTLEQMRENHLEHTTQYSDDNSKLQEIQADIKNLEEDLDELGPCPIPECNKRTPDSEELNALIPSPVKNCNFHAITAESTHMEIEQPLQVVEKRQAAKRKNSTDSQE